MYDFKTYSNEYKDIKYQCKNEHNQTLRMYFTRYKSIYERKIRWYITFLITDKRKQKYQDIQLTGKDGLKSLLWAKRCLMDFIENKISKDVENQIVICWSNSLRKRVYERGIKNLGFRMSTVDGNPSLILHINKERCQIDWRGSSSVS